MPRLLLDLRSLSLILALTVAPSVAAAQTVVGTVRDEGNGQPVLGAMVRLMADSTWTGVLFLTAADGRFSLRAPGPGRYRIRVERIGFESAIAGPVVLSPGATTTFDVGVAGVAISLEGLEVAAGRRRCSLEDDPRGETQALWGEVRKALDAARWTEREAGLQFEVVQRTVTLDPTGRHVLEEQRNTMSAYGGNSVRTLPPDELAEEGYIREDESFVYHYGPDAKVLLSDEFLATHCFAIVDGPAEEPGLVGLEFEPVRGRDVSDIEGVLWVDRATARLDRVDFTYADARLRPGVEPAGGEISFTELSDGRWIVRDWSVRVPVLGLSRQFVAGSLRERVVVTGVQEQGSEVMWARGQGVEWRADRPPGRVAGTVWDSIAGTGLADAEVMFGGRTHQTRTDSAGSFTFEEVAPGPYWVTFAHPVLDSLDVKAAWREVVVETGTTAQVALAVPGLMSLLAHHCAPPGIVVGRVLNEEGQAVAGAVVSAEGTVGRDGVPLSAVSRADGGFWICAGAASGTARLVARLGSAFSESRTVPLVPVGRAEIDLVLGGPG